MKGALISELYIARGSQKVEDFIEEDPQKQAPTRHRHLGSKKEVQYHVVVVVVVVVAATARLSPVQNWGQGKMGCKIALSKSGQSARVHTGEGISRMTAPIHLGDRFLCDLIGGRHGAISF